MKLFLLKRTGDVGWDENEAMLIRAKNEQTARTMANVASADEGEIWTDNKKVDCIVVTAKGRAGILITDFNAG